MDKEINSKEMFSNIVQNMLNDEGPKLIEEGDREDKCIIHGSYKVHFVRYDNGREIVTPKVCPMCEKEREEEKRQREAEKNRIELLEEYRSRNISPEYFDKSLSDYIPTSKGQEAALKGVNDIITSKKKKLILIGSNGTGKTMLGNIAVKIMGGKIYTMYEIATRIRQSYMPGSKETELQIVNGLIEEPLLVIDEVGRLKMSEAVQDWFSYILDKRHTRGKPYFLIGNLHFKKDCGQKDGCPKCFENYFDKDILSRLTQDSTIVEIFAEDKRREQHTFNFITDRR